MRTNISIAKSDTIFDIDRKIFEFEKDVSEGENELFLARLSGDTRSGFFKEIWTAMAVASGLREFHKAKLIAWGLQEWPNELNENEFVFSLACLIALQNNSQVLTDTNPPIVLDHDEVIKRIILKNGLLTSSRQRNVFELEPQMSTAPVLSAEERNKKAKFFDFIRSQLHTLDVGPDARKSLGTDTFRKETILTFLYELHSNAAQHGSAKNGVRLLRMQKHPYLHRDQAISRSEGFDELKAFIQSKPTKPSGFMFNLIEFSVSDFGLGIVDGFLSSFASRAYKNASRLDLLEELLHERLSSKLGDPNAGAGTMDALAAANSLGAFVSLRTAEFWLTMDGAGGGTPRMALKEGQYPKVVGTHWQLLLPDWTINSQPDLFDA